tara:strand:+ start:12878 stop:13333 length:456 start_codon:yes stop_codon:yes gene_type:complete
MPNYKSREPNVEMETNEDDIGNLNYKQDILPPIEEEQEEHIESIGGGFGEIMNSKKPHKRMINKVLKMKPADIHLIKRGAKYFMDNEDELRQDVEFEALEDLSHIKGSNDLADMLENDYEITQGGEDIEGSLLETLGYLLEDIAKKTRELK